MVNKFHSDAGGSLQSARNIVRDAARNVRDQAQLVRVAARMGLKPLSNADLGLTGPQWKGKAPLWYYVLKEAELFNNGRRMGPVGGRIVAETILGILALDKTSYLYAPGGYVPEFPTVGDFLLAAGTSREMVTDVEVP